MSDRRKPVAALPDAAASPVALLDGDGVVRVAGGREAGAIAGYQPAELVGTSLLELVHPHDLVAVLDRFVDVRDHRCDRAETPTRLRGPDGAYRDVLLVMDDMPGHREVVVSCRDVTTTAMAAEALRVTALHAALVEHTRALLAVFEIDGRVRYVNPASVDVLGPLHGHDRTLASLLDATHPDDAEMLRERFGTVARTLRARATCTVRIATSAPEAWRTLDLELANRLDDPAIGGIVADAIDVTDRVHLEADLVHRALHDPLTGLANRVLLNDRLAHAMSRLARGAEPLMVAYLDLDGFKAINDTHGHAIGDEVLATIAHRLEACVRPGDTVARIGGDEFVIVCPDVGVRDAATILADRLLDAVREPFDDLGAGGPSGCTGSLGVVVVEQEHDAEAVLRTADRAMYRAKDGGRSRAEFERLPAGE